MTKNYLNDLLDAFDQEFESLVIPFPKQNLQEVTTNFAEPELIDENAQKLSQIQSLATEISAERYSPNYNPEICLANLINFILSDDTTPNLADDFFQLLNQERNVDLNQALTDFDFYMDNPYKKKAEKILSKIEARKNK